MSTFFVAQNNWTFGLNDPSIFAWLILVVIFLAAYLCWLAIEPSIASDVVARNRTWVFLTVILVLLGINKQLDLHLLVMEKMGDFLATTNVGGLSRPLLLAIAVLLFVLLALAWRLLSRFLFHIRLGRHQFVAFAALIVLLVSQVARFLPGPLSHVLVYHVFSEDEKSLFHLHYIELLELFCFMVVGFTAITSRMRTRIWRGRQSDQTGQIP